MAASEPTSSLSSALDTLHPLTLSQYFGALTAVWVVPLLGVKLTPDSPFPEIFGAETFGVGQMADPFQDLNPQSVSLPFQQPPSRLDCGLFWQEPAITGFDWLFTPSRKLKERLHAAPLQASTKFYLCFTLPTVRSPGFGLYSSNSGHFHTPLLTSCERVAFALNSPYQIILATEINSLARYSKRTIEHLDALSNHRC